MSARATPASRRARYRVGWQDQFRAAIVASLRPGMVVLDAGGGRHPVLDGTSVPDGVEVHGLDISRRELDAAPAGSYARTVVADLTRREAALEASYDLIVCWQVLEHVACLGDTLDNLRSYLRDGGVLVAHFSGRWSAFGVLNRMVPDRVAKVGMQRALGRDPESVFPAPYDACTWSATSRLLASWSEHEVVPRYVGAPYFRFSRHLEEAYLQFEDAMERGRHRDLATHYLLVARR